MYNVLICDDQPDIVNALKIYLAPEGYRLFEAFTGKQAQKQPQCTSAGADEQIQPMAQKNSPDTRLNHPGQHPTKGH